MKYYQQISLLPTVDIGLYFLWQKTYQQIHLALVESNRPDGKSEIGVAFPEYDAKCYFLGKRMRLFSEQMQILEQLQCKKWFNRLRDYVHIDEIKSVPEKLTGYACFRHIKFKGNKEKLARRRAQRKGETFQEALSHYGGFEEQRSRLPYINMISQTNGHRFRLFIEMQEMKTPQSGFFSCYGLSNTTTVPLF